MKKNAKVLLAWILILASVLTVPGMSTMARQLRKPRSWK